MTMFNHSRFRRTYPMTPSQQAANGALDIFVEGFRRADAAQMIFGLSVLRNATAAQVEAAMVFVQSTGRATPAEIGVMLAS